MLPLQIVFTLENIPDPDETAFHRSSMLAKEPVYALWVSIQSLLKHLTRELGNQMEKKVCLLFVFLLFFFFFGGGGGGGGGRRGFFF